MSTLTASLADSADLIAKGVEVEFRAELRRRFDEVAKQLVEEAAVAAAKNVVANVEAFHRAADMNIVVQVAFNNKVLTK